MAGPDITPPRNKLVEAAVAAPDRKPSPQPAHFPVPLARNGNGNGRVIRSATIGYVAPEFKGKKAQMEQGKQSICNITFHGLTTHSKGKDLRQSLDTRASH